MTHWMSTDQRICACTRYKHWYNIDRTDVCECGHKYGDHLETMCIGDVIVYRLTNTTNGCACKDPQCIWNGGDGHY